MKKAVLFLCYLLAASAFAQDAERAPRERWRERMAEMSPEQRQQWREGRDARREERQQHREAWQRMSPEERHQLRQDIRSSGQRIYPRGGR